ncbi:hypothetical protein EGI22_04395 [Lacihabitans sp. LS3-19]|nr:hypothetical protein [Lacihabitans sp. LS3-19]
MSQNRTNIQATSPEISDNLDLEAVASLFGEVKNLEEFERILNDENEHLSNLDLNNDGFTDYLRVVETVEGNTHVITIQAALGNNIFQDVATIDVDRNSNNNSYVQVIGNPYFYGNNYIINPIYYGTPFYVNSFWSPYYSPWRSPYYWSYYPTYYRPYRPWPVNRYVNHVSIKRNVKNTYNYTNERRSIIAPNIQKQIRRDDYSSKQPNRSFDARNRNLTNRADLDRSRNSNNSPTPNTRNNTYDRRGDTRTNQNRPNSNTQKPSTSRESRRANPTPSTKPSGSRKSGNSSGSSSGTRKNTKRGN